MNHVYDLSRVITWILDLITFVILTYKFVYNNFTGKNHQVNWSAVGMMLLVFGYCYGIAEVTLRSIPGGSRTIVNLVIAILVLWISLFKVPITRELKSTYLPPKVGDL
jgi:hypothetical protein